MNIMKDRYIKILIKILLSCTFFYSTSKMYAQINYYFLLVKKYKYNIILFIYYVIYIYDSNLKYINFKYLFVFNKHLKNWIKINEIVRMDKKYLFPIESEKWNY